MKIGAGSFIFFGCIIVSVILHEISHGVVALAFGDDTAKRAGRLTLNPVPHIDPVGSILLPGMMVLAGAPAFGWAKPVPVNPSRLRDPRRQMLWVGLVGPFTNFTLMLIAATAVRNALTSLTSGSTITILGVQGPLLLVTVVTFARVNLFLGLFNLLPIPPLDGSSLIERVLPRAWMPGWYRYRQYGFLVLFAAVFLFHLLDRIIVPFDNALFHYMAHFHSSF
jgi:Zn-dependent protease